QRRPIQTILIGYLVLANNNPRLRFTQWNNPPVTQNQLSSVASRGNIFHFQIDNSRDWLCFSNHIQASDKQPNEKDSSTPLNGQSAVKWNDGSLSLLLLYAYKNPIQRFLDNRIDIRDI